MKRHYTRSERLARKTYFELAKRGLLPSDFPQGFDYSDEEQCVKKGKWIERESGRDDYRPVEKVFTFIWDKWALIVSANKRVRIEVFGEETRCSVIERANTWWKGARVEVGYMVLPLNQIHERISKEKEGVFSWKSIIIPPEVDDAIFMYERCTGTRE